MGAATWAAHRDSLAQEAWVQSSVWVSLVLPLQPLKNVKASRSQGPKASRLLWGALPGWAGGPADPIQRGCGEGRCREAGCRQAPWLGQARKLQETPLGLLHVENLCKCLRARGFSAAFLLSIQANSSIIGHGTLQREDPPGRGCPQQPLHLPGGRPPGSRPTHCPAARDQWQPQGSFQSMSHLSSKPQRIASRQFQGPWPGREPARGLHLALTPDTCTTQPDPGPHWKQKGPWASEEQRKNVSNSPARPLGPCWALGSPGVGTVPTLTPEEPGSCRKVGQRCQQRGRLPKPHFEGHWIIPCGAISTFSIKRCPDVRPPPFLALPESSALARGLGRGPSLLMISPDRPTLAAFMDCLLHTSPWAEQTGVYRIKQPLGGLTGVGDRSQSPPGSCHLCQCLLPWEGPELEPGLPLKASAHPRVSLGSAHGERWQSSPDALTC